MILFTKITITMSQDPQLKILCILSILLQEYELCPNGTRQIEIPSYKLTDSCNLDLYQLENILKKFIQEELIEESRTTGLYGTIIQIKLPVDFKKRCRDYVLTTTELGQKEMDKLKRIVRQIEEQKKITPEEHEKIRKEGYAELERIYTNIDYTDSTERKAWKIKWDVIQTIWQYLITYNRPQKMRIPIQAFTIKGKTTAEIDGVLDGLEKKENCIFTWHRGTHNYEISFILSTHSKRLEEVYKKTKVIYEKFAGIEPEKDLSLQESKITNSVKIESTKPYFDENKGKIIWGNKECSIPLNTNQYFFCKKIFSEPFGERVKEIDILNLIDWDKDSKRSVYDAMRAVNKRIKGCFEIDDFFKWRNNHTWINEEIFKK